LNHEISLLKKSIDSVNHLHEGQCPTCYQSVDNEVKKITLNTLNKKIEEVNLLKEEFEVKKENQTNSIKLQISTKIENLEKDLKQEIENEKNKKIDLKKEISSKIEDITLLIEKNITTIDKIKEGIGKYFSLLEVHNQKSELSLELKSKEADYNQKISVNNIEIKNFQKEIKDIDSDILLNKKETLKSKINDKNNFIQLSNEEKLLEKNLIIFDELKKKLEEGKSIKVDENIEELNNEFFDLKNKI
jgi:DNA repair exonuclease SbcCD ATPase subunit